MEIFHNDLARCRWFGEQFLTPLSFWELKQLKAVFMAITSN